MVECIVFTGGGTGGHVFPALAVLEELTPKWRGRIIWIGSISGIERNILKKKKIPYYGIPCGKLRRYLSLQNFLDIFKIVSGIIASFFIMLKEKPLILFSKGGYVTVPPVIAASILGIPVITHESDLKPGLATRINSLFAEKILISFTGTVEYFKDTVQRKTLHTGNPIRTSLLTGLPGYGKKVVGCSSGMPILLVLGGSQGSSFLNHLILSEIEGFTKTCFVVHQMGLKDFKRIKHNNYYSSPFFYEELPHILAASDLVVCRSGANTLWELAALGKPSILIPLTHLASRGDQIENAQFFALKGASIVLPEWEASGRRLLGTVLNLIDNKSKLDQMGQKAFFLSLPDSAPKIADLLWERSRKASGGA